MSDFNIDQEQAEFEKQLPAMLERHKGEFVLMKNGEVIDYFKTIEAGYAAAMKKFGSEGVFLLAPIEPCNPAPISIAWETGVMFG